MKLKELTQIPPEKLMEELVKAQKQRLSTFTIGNTIFNLPNLTEAGVNWK